MKWIELYQDEQGNLREDWHEPSYRIFSVVFPHGIPMKSVGMGFLEYHNKLEAAVTAR